MSSLDIAAAQSSFLGHLRAPGTNLFLHCQTQLKVRRRRGKSEEQSAVFVRAIATIERKSSPAAENNSIFDLHPSNSPGFDDERDMDEREKKRRERISKANKGNVPWNKGRKHSPETLQKIRERTKLAMQNPKVKMKLVNIGHAQSEETRIKIGVGVREGWQRRREMLMVQESCFFEWQNLIAEASRKGYGGEDELEWDSYETLDEQLMQEWLESIESRRTMPRMKGSKRAPKSAEQRKKISEAISAKWADPNYRVRVCSGLAKYHGIPEGAERRPRRKPAGDEASDERKAAKKRTLLAKEAEKEDKAAKLLIQKKKKSSAPSYKDPMAKSKLEMIRKIREQRATLDEKKRDAAERARLLIAEAEKAADALEIAAQKSPLARASLLETRKLIAEATKSLESMGFVTDQSSSPPLNSSRSVNLSDRKPVNGTSSSVFSDPPTNEEDEDLPEESERLWDIQDAVPMDSVESPSRSGDESSPPEKTGEIRTKWLRGRLVEVEAEDE